ncbi:uncharacterized protein N7498_001642 [Penicillium cinerascens]|uniref:ATP-dependent DNA helicase n=1 Tax=Penicillium cinerascens TaxID=70096 RepID=A0A9W9N8I9_9EURO|nr:uncharacterized protein N7498_001642 [Penicillium cinerascens]KAJ5215235.1 hypothetical protein N7498_001642 [Penicillium cinerascens]
MKSKTQQFPVPGSFVQKLRMRSEIRGLIVTINPSDLRSPLIIILASVEYSDDILSASSSAIRGATATSNPVAVASFFHSVCTAILDGLFASGRDRTGILGDVSNHYGVVETNSRGMLHLHAIMWLKGNLSFTNLRSRVLADAKFTTRVLHYLESVIIQSINKSSLVDPEVNLVPISPSASDPESDHDFHIRLADDSNLVARSKHFATYFKNRPTDRSKKICRFGMPREIVPSSKIDDLGNPAIASYLRSNHDISWLPTVSKSLALVYYITNYATKDDLIAKGALLKQAIKKAKATDPPTANNLRLRERNIDNFALRCFNSLAHDREVSSVQVASTLLHLPNYYTVDTKFAGDIAPVSLFDNYKWRGVDLATFSFFNHKKPFQDGDLSNITPHLPNFNLVDEDSMLQPILINASMPSDSLVRLDLENPTPDSLLRLIVKDIPLNTKQLLVVRKLLTKIMSWTKHPHDSSRRGQLLLYITGEGGTGKTQIPKAIEAALCIISRKHKIILTAPTGAAADNLGGNTYHTSLSINLSYKATISTRVRRLWARKTILVIDEISMVDLKMLSVINNQCKVARSLPRSSPDLFGGLLVVILIGDFFQFPPVRGPPL